MEICNKNDQWIENPMMISKLDNISKKSGKNSTEIYQLSMDVLEDQIQQIVDTKDVEFFY